MTEKLEELTIGNEGAQLFPALLSTDQLGDLQTVLAARPQDHAGVRLAGIPELRPFLDPAGSVGQIPASVLGPKCHPVRAILFAFRLSVPPWHTACDWTMA
jgi:hypothetical protein